MEHKVSVKYAGGQKEYTIPFEYLAKKFIHVTIDEVELTYNVDYRVEGTQVVLLRTTVPTQTIEIYRKTATSRLIEFNDGSVLRGDDLTTFQQQILHVVEEQGLYGAGGGSIGEGESSYGSFWFDSVKEMQAYPNLSVGHIVHTRNYDASRAGGGAQYRVVKDNKDKYGNAIPWALTLANGLYAMLDEHREVNYRMFGAVLDGISNDEPAMRNCHRYADSHFVYDDKGLTKIYTCKVAQHDGVIYKKGTDAIVCSSDVDLSGATLLVDDSNATWYGIYVWGDNNSLYYDLELSDEVKQDLKADAFFLPHVGTDHFHQNTVIKLEEDPYCARDDSGYLYTVARRELLVHAMDGICASPLTDDWQHAGGEEINCQISDLGSGTVKNAQSFTHFKASFTYLPAVRGTFIGCDVRLAVSAGKYCSVMWCKRHNADIRDFTFRPRQGELHNRKFKNAMIYLWDSYNVTVKNLQGFNASGKKNGSTNGTSGYMLRITNCSDVRVENCMMQGYWGATAMDSVKNIYFKNCHLNRLDIHDYFSNLYAEECVFYNHAIQIGYGRGVASFTNCIFHYNDIPTDSYGSAHMVEFNLTYGRIFEGLVNVDGCRAIVHNPADDEFNIFKMEFSPDATTITKHFQFPEINCRNCLIESNNPNSHFAGFKITGTRRATTGTQKPTHVYGVCNDGSASWRFIGRGVQWGGEHTQIKKNEVVRVFDSFLDTEKKTQFYNVRYYICTKAGALSFGTKPTRTDTSEFQCGTATLKYAPDILWKAKYAYNKGDICAVSQSNWFELYMYECTKGGTSSGYFPTHTSGTELDGKNDSVNEPDSCWWTYIGKTKDLYGTWTAGMSVSAGQKFIAEGRMYEVLSEGKLPEHPPYDTAWFGQHRWGTATLKFIGQVWTPHAWYAKDSYCEARGNIYQLAKHDGITSGITPTRGNPYCVDGDIIWEYVSGNGGADTWRAQTPYSIGDTVVSHGNTYRCAFDGVLVMPQKTIFENIITNMKGHVFWFFRGTNIPTRQGTQPWELIVRNCNGLSTDPEGVHDFFGRSGNPKPVLATTTEGAVPTVDSYTKSEVNHLLNDKANVNHGHHLPAPEATDNTRFLRNDGTYQKVTPTAIGAYTKGETDTLLGGKAPLASPALTGKPTAPTAAKGTNDTQIANTAFVAQTVATLVNSAPETLDTLQELAKALNNDPNFATTMLNLLAGKVGKNGDILTGGITFTTNTQGIKGYVANDVDHWRLWGASGSPEVAWDIWSYDNRTSCMFCRRFINDQLTESIYLFDAAGDARFPRKVFAARFEGTASNAEKLGNMTLDQLLAEVDRRIAAKHP